MKARIGSIRGTSSFAPVEVLQTPATNIEGAICHPLAHLEESLKAHLRDAKRAMAARDLKQARANFEWVLKRKPNQLAALVGLRWVAAREN